MRYLGNSFGLETFFPRSGVSSSGRLCRPKHAGDLELRSMNLVVTALAAKLYWHWCNTQDEEWAKIITKKYFLGVDCFEVPQLPLVGKVSCIWNTLKRGGQIVKEGLF